jgi:hypothetical protein
VLARPLGSVARQKIRLGQIFSSQDRRCWYSFKPENGSKLRDRVAAFASDVMVMTLIFQVIFILSTGEHFEIKCCPEVTDFHSTLY